MKMLVPGMMELHDPVGGGGGGGGGGPPVPTTTVAVLCTLPADGVPTLRITEYVPLFAYVCAGF